MERSRTSGRQTTSPPLQLFLPSHLSHTQSGSISAITHNNLFNKSEWIFSFKLYGCCSEKSWISPSVPLWWTASFIFIFLPDELSHGFKPWSHSKKQSHSPITCWELKSQLKPNLLLISRVSFPLFVSSSPWLFSLSASGDEWGEINSSGGRDL